MSSPKHFEVVIVEVGSLLRRASEERSVVVISGRGDWSKWMYSTKIRKDDTCFVCFVSLIIFRFMFYSTLNRLCADVVGIPHEFRKEILCEL